MVKERALLPAFVAIVIALAQGCGPPETENQASASASASGSGAGGGGGGEGGGGGGGGSGGSAACSEGYVVVVDDGKKRNLTAACYGSWGAMQGATSAFGYIDAGGGAMVGGGLVIQACAGADEVGFPILRLDTGLTAAGATNAGSAFYARSDAETYGAQGTAEVDVTQLDDVGGLVKGDFTVTVTGTGAQPGSLVLAGSFSVCRVDDGPPKP